MCSENSLTCSFLKAKHFYSSFDLTNFAVVIKSQSSAAGTVTCAGLFCLVYVQSDAYSFALYIKHFISICGTCVWFSAFKKTTLQQVNLCYY